MYNDISALTTYQPIFFIQIFIAECLFCGNLRKTNGYIWKMPLCLVVGMVISFFIPMKEYTSLYGSLLFFSLFAVSVLMLTFLYAESVSALLFCSSAAFTMQHIASEVFELLYAVAKAKGFSGGGIYGSDTGNNPLLIANDYFLTVAYYSIYFLVYFYFSIIPSFKYKRENERGLTSLSVGIITAFSVLINVVFGAIAIWSVPSGFSFVGLVLIHLWNVACCVLLLFLMFELLRRRTAETELAVTKEIHKRERVKYEQAKSEREALNIRCHDLKHQIHSVIGKSAAIGDEAVKEIEKTINVFDTMYSTGNVALDVILGEKDTLGRSKNIKFSPMADGKALSFMSEVDIYSLFGNILDNAIEASEKLPEAERFIGLKVYRQNSFVIINATNAFSGEIKQENGNIVTTKTDRESHGYGLKSIKYVVEKYDGKVDITAQKGVFTLTVLFVAPVAENEGEK